MKSPLETLPVYFEFNFKLGKTTRPEFENAATAICEMLKKAEAKPDLIYGPHSVKTQHDVQTVVIELSRFIADKQGKKLVGKAMMMPDKLDRDALRFFAKQFKNYNILLILHKKDVRKVTELIYSVDKEAQNTCFVGAILIK